MGNDSKCRSSGGERKVNGDTKNDRKWRLLGVAF